MKKILLSMALLLTLGSSAPAVAQRHRHTPRTEKTVQQSAANDQKQSADKAIDPKSSDEGIEAYSDTSSVAKEDTTSYASSPGIDDSDDFSPSRFNDPFSWFATMSTTFGGVVIAIFVILFVLVFLLMPLIITLLIIRYFIRRHNDRVRLAEKAMETGQPLTDEQMPLSRKSPEYMWRRGVRNVSIGLGLMAFFWFLGAESIVGIGALIAFMGAGQMFMVRYNYNSSFGRNKKKDNDDFGGFYSDSKDLMSDDEKK